MFQLDAYVGRVQGMTYLVMGLEGVHVDCVQVVTYIVRHVSLGVYVERVQGVHTLYDMVYQGVPVNCVQVVIYIVRYVLLRCTC